ncbi:hypothetical protein ACSBR1_007133 [Camellia fascicularis]
MVRRVSWLLFGTFLSFTFGLLMNIPSSGCPYEPVVSLSAELLGLFVLSQDLWSGCFLSAFSTFETHGEPKGCGKKGFGTRSNGWTAAVKRVMNGGSMRRIQERVLGLYKTGIFSSTSDIWHLGFWYKISQDVNWVACFGAAGQMLVAQGDPGEKLLISHSTKNTFEILHLFGDSEASTLSIHNLLQAGNGYDLAAGSWVGPYAMCHTWESLVRFKREESELEDQSFPMAIYVVSGDEDGERGGAPIVCIENASRHCFEFSKGQANWTPFVGSLSSWS